MNTLRPAQRPAVDFLLERPPELNGKPHRLLAIDAGGGKTPISCAAIRKLRALSGLIICPVSVKQNWAAHLVDWAGIAPASIFIINRFADIIPDLAKFVIVNPELLIRSYRIDPKDKKSPKLRDERILKQLQAGRYAVCIVDEVQRFKSRTGIRSSVLFGKNALIANATYKWLLSATAMPNSPIELYPMLAALAPELIAPYISERAYGKQFCAGYFDKDRLEWNFKGASNVEDLRDRIAPFIYVQKIEDIYPEMPPVIEDTVYLDIGHDALNQYMTAKANAVPSATLRRNLALDRLKPIIEYVKDRLEDGEKLLLFAYHRAVVEGICEALGDCSTKIYGDMTAKQREANKQAFIHDLSKLVLVAQVNSAGEAIDGFQHVCNNVIFVELDWPAGSRDQQLGRLKRFGQTKTIFAVSLVARRTLDDPIRNRVDQKKATIDILFANVHRFNLTVQKSCLSEQKIDTDTTFKEKYMPLEEALLEHAAALREHAAALKAAAGVGEIKAAAKPAAASAPAEAKAEKETKPKADKAPAKPKLTCDDARKAAQELINTSTTEAGKQEAAAKVKEVLKKVGVKQLGDIKEAHIQQVVDELKAAAVAAPEPAASEESELDGLDLSS